MTFDKPSKWVTEGVYQYSRNPMYLGLVITLFGSALLMGVAIVSLLLVGVLGIIIDRWYIAFEEKAMRHAFGLEYEAYCQNVRR